MVAKLNRVSLEGVFLVGICTFITHYLEAMRYVQDL